MWQRDRVTDSSPWRGVLLLLATVTATELMMLNIIFWARAEASLPGLALAVAWPWMAAAVSLAIWQTKERWLPSERRVNHTKLSVGIGLALAFVVLVGRLALVA